MFLVVRRELVFLQGHEVRERCVAVCCNVLQYVAVCCSVLQRGRELVFLQGHEVREWCVAVCCSMLQYAAVCCSVVANSYFFKGKKYKGGIFTPDSWPVAE